MHEVDLPPGPFKGLHDSLKQFIKPTQEVAQIRRVLALQLSAHVNLKEGVAISQPLSLLSGPNVESAASGIRGARREYLRCLRANTKAREEYEKIKRAHQTVERQRLDSDIHDKDDITAANSLATFSDVVTYRRKHERLRICQDYLNMLAQKPAAGVNYLNPQVVLQNVDSPPSVPSELMSSTVPHQESQQTNLNELVEQLEKSVMRAKLLLKRDQSLLAKVKSRVQSSSWPGFGSKLQALGSARNELIQWIETELAKASESPTVSSYEKRPQSGDTKGRGYINNHLSRIQRQYVHYAKTRQALIIAATSVVEPPTPIPAEDEVSVLEKKEEALLSNAMSHILLPYLEDLTSASTEQKSTLQQKSHLTFTLTRQLKEAGQGIDRLADESHLLPLHPLGIVQTSRLKSSPTFEEEISGHEQLDSSRKARNWVYASEISRMATQEAVTDKLEDGGAAISDAGQTLLNLRALLGEDSGAGREGHNLSINMWAALDGHLGSIAMDNVA